MDEATALRFEHVAERLEAVTARAETFDQRITRLERLAWMLAGMQALGGVLLGLYLAGVLRFHQPATAERWTPPEPVTVVAVL